jgi:hypothetical protein
VLLFNALIGCCCLEWAWHKTLRFRKPNPELNAQFNMFARTDAPHWRKWQFYPGALTVLLPRILIGVLIAVLTIIFVNILLIGQRKSDPIAPGCRKFMLRFFYKMFANFQAALTFWTYISYEYT